MWQTILCLHLSYQQPQGANATNDCQNRDLFPCSHGPQGSPARWQQGKPCTVISCGFPIHRPYWQVLVQGPTVVWECTILLENISNCKRLFSPSFQVFSKDPEKDFSFFFSPGENAIFFCLGFCLRGEVQTTVQSKSADDLLAMMVGLMQQGYGRVASSRVKSFRLVGEDEWEKEEELQRAKGNCQSLKGSNANPEERGWEKSQEFLESGRTSLVQFGASL